LGKGPAEADVRRRTSDVRGRTSEDGERQRSEVGRQKTEGTPVKYATLVIVVSR